MIDGFLIELWVGGAICSCTFAVVYARLSLEMI